MKNKLFLLIICYFTLSSPVLLKSQEIKPEGQAKGYIEMSNSSIDYCTGIFNYKIPLFEITSGSYKLPVQLQYRANGIKYHLDKPGICGWGWEINCGGIVTRTLRGGIPDEDMNIGYATHPIEEIVDSIRLAVEQHKRDGEVDIFTAIFNNKRVDFFIELTPDKQELRAVPLNKTNIRIENVPIGHIPSWKITDEDGIQYIFAEKEIMIDIRIEEAVSDNSIKRDTCISSWHLTKIIIPDSPDIVFKYDSYDPGYDKRKELISQYVYKSTLIYQYGEPMRERTYDLSPYEDIIDGAVQDAQMLITKLRLGESFDLAMASIEDFRSTSLERFQEHYDMIQFYDNVYGLLTDVGKVSSISQEVINMMNTCMLSIDPSMGSDYSRLYRNFQTIKNCFIEAIENVEDIYFRKVISEKSFQIYSKRIAEITNSKEKIKFSYEGWRPIELYDITLYSYLLDPITKVKLEYGNHLLKKIHFQGNRGEHTLTQQFDYYKEGETLGDVKDWWGFPTGRMSQIVLEGPIRDMSLSTILNKEGSREPNPEYAKALSLKKIKYSTGGEIEIDYEGNSYYPVPFGGIRAKHIIVRDENGKEDTTRYHYEKEVGKDSGHPLSNDLESNYTWLEYEDFEDIIYRDQKTDDGIGIINTGNNGVMYEYILEERVGKGSTGYYFYIPYSRQEGIVLELGYLYYLCGLPIGKIEYNEQGQIMQVQKNRYCADIFAYNVKYADHFIAAPDNFIYHNGKLQIKSSGLWFDPDKQREKFSNKEDIRLFKDGYRDYKINPYEEFYEPNLEPRSSIQLPEIYYDLLYGGNVLLHKQENYTIDVSTLSTIPRSPRYDDFTTFNQGNHFISSTVEYEYGNEHEHPLKTFYQRSNGDIIYEYEWSVADIEPNNNSSLIFQEMKAGNYLTPIVAKRTYLLKNDISYLIKENVNEFSSRSLDNKPVYFISSSYELNKSIPEQCVLPGTGKLSNIFTSLNTDYKKIDIDYSLIAHHHQIIHMDAINESTTFVYDRGNGNRILSTKNIIPEEVDAVDYVRNLGLKDYEKEIRYKYINTYEGGNEEEHQQRYSMKKGIAGETLSNILSVTPTSQSKNYTIIIVAICSKNQSINLHGEIKLLNGQTTDISINIGTGNGYWQVFTGNIDLSTTVDNQVVESLKIYIPEEVSLLTALAVLIPSGAEFEAVSIDRLGRTFCKLNQLMQLERYSYDENGQVSAIFDGKGNIINYYQRDEKKNNIQ